MKDTCLCTGIRLANTTLAQNTTGYMRGEQNLSLLPEVDSQMFAPAPETSADLAIALLVHYGFDLSGYSAVELVELWQKQYPGNWLHLAVIEALYQGRYKAVSVQQILTCWQRRGQAIFHFNMEFERLICSKFPQNLTALPVLPPAPGSTTGHEEQRQWVTEPVPQTSFPSPASGVGVTSVETSSGKVSADTEIREHEEIALSSHSPTSLETYQEDNSLPVTTNNPPIEQFTPETHAGSESFTSKLKAISYEKFPSRRLVTGRGRDRIRYEND